MITKIINKTLLAGIAAVGLSGCPDSITHNHYYGTDNVVSADVAQRAPDDIRLRSPDKGARPDIYVTKDTAKDSSSDTNNYLDLGLDEGIDMGTVDVGSDPGVSFDDGFSHDDSSDLGNDNNSPDLSPCIETLYFIDNDNDGHGSLTDAVLACEKPINGVLISGDCDDNNSFVHLGATEYCDGKDNNCDQLIDEVDCSRCENTEPECYAVLSEKDLGDEEINLNQDDLCTLVDEVFQTSFDSYKYEQDLEVRLSLPIFTENDDDEQGYFIRVDDQEMIAQYRIEFDNSAISNLVDSNLPGRKSLVDFLGSNLILMGDSYTIVQADIVGQDINLSFFSGGTRGTLFEGGNRGYLINGLDYDITLYAVLEDKATFDINGERFEVSFGGNYVLADGNNFGVTGITYQGFAGGVRSAGMSLGHNVLRISSRMNGNSNLSSVKFNEETIRDLYVNISGDLTQNTVEIEELGFTAIADDDIYLGVGNNLISIIEQTTGENNLFPFNWDVFFNSYDSDSGKARLQVVSEATMSVTKPAYCFVPADLCFYPDMFVSNGRFNGFAIVGENAQPADNLALTDILTSMKYRAVDGTMQPVEMVDVTKLDSEIADIYAQNLLVIGSPCVNTITSKLAGNPIDCSEGYEPGKAKVQLYRHDNGKFAMVVAGYSGPDTRLAGKIVANQPQELCGSDVIEIEGTTYTPIDSE